MICLDNNLEKLNIEKPVVVTLGKFDGLHKGHQSLIKRTVELAREMNCEPCAFIMDRSEKRLLTEDERLKILEKLGIRRIIELPLTPEFMSQEPEVFIQDILMDKLHAKAVIVGENYRFGCMRKGNASLLKKEGIKRDFLCEALPMISDQGEKISSTAVRKHLSQGKMKRVIEELGYAYTISGEIVHGHQLGRKMETPTTNIIPHKVKLLPPKGVYASLVKVEDHCYKGMTNIGVKPTVDGSELGVETYLFDCHEDLYGKEERVYLFHHTRPEQKFNSIEELSGQLMKDKEEVSAFFSNLIGNKNEELSGNPAALEYRNILDGQSLL